MNRAETFFEPSRVTEQAPELEHAPSQPANMLFTAGVGVRDMIDPLEYDAVQVAPQLIPAGVEVMLPLPVPVLDTI